jgi:hypothetical protein
MRRAKRDYRRHASTAYFVTNADMKRLLPALNQLAECLLVARARGENTEECAISVADLGLSSDDCLDLVSSGLVVPCRRARPTKLGSRGKLTLTDAGLGFLQKAIPAGALRPVYDISSRTLSVAGEIILGLAVQARNQAAVLTAMEVAGWKGRVSSPLGECRCANDAHHLAATTYHLSLHQILIEFHADDGSATWNWRPTGAGQTQSTARREL